MRSFIGHIKCLSFFLHYFFIAAMLFILLVYNNGCSVQTYFFRHSVHEFSSILFSQCNFVPFFPFQLQFALFGNLNDLGGGSKGGALLNFVPLFLLTSLLRVYPPLLGMCPIFMAGDPSALACSCCSMWSSGT